ncbi:MAG: hypothetical protein ABRQ37_23135, partial [Candidatus Eremiobacterota bacterium]
QYVIELAAIICGVVYIAAVVSSIAGIVMPFLNKDIFFASAVEALLMNVIIMALFSIVIPNFIRHRPSSGYCAYCQSNIKNLATALEMYSTDYEGRYPPSLSYLTMNNSYGPYMKSIPVCPVSRKKDTYSYIVSARPDNYTLWCNVRGAHSRAGYPKNECWPQYNCNQGLMLPQKTF